MKWNGRDNEQKGDDGNGVASMWHTAPCSSNTHTHNHNGQLKYKKSNGHRRDARAAWPRYGHKMCMYDATQPHAPWPNLTIIYCAHAESVINYYYFLYKTYGIRTKMGNNFSLLSMSVPVSSVYFSLIISFLFVFFRCWPTVGPSSYACNIHTIYRTYCNCSIRFPLPNMAKNQSGGGGGSTTIIIISRQNHFNFVFILCQTGNNKKIY